MEFFGHVLKDRIGRGGVIPGLLPWYVVRGLIIRGFLLIRQEDPRVSRSSMHISVITAFNSGSVGALQRHMVFVNHLIRCLYSSHWSKSIISLFPGLSHTEPVNSFSGDTSSSN